VAYVDHRAVYERLPPFCGFARTLPHRFVFLEGVKTALTADTAIDRGWYDEPPTTRLRALARVYAG
jgi:homoserine O-acetyltransferase/O-succinyltransferase